MDQIWETLTKSNAFLEKLQKNQTPAQVESHSNFVDMEKKIEKPQEFKQDYPSNSNSSLQIQKHKYHNSWRRPHNNLCCFDAAEQNQSEKGPNKKWTSH